MKINEILAEAGGSAFGSFLRGAGLTHGADAIDARSRANTLAPGVRQVSDLETQATNASNISRSKMSAANAGAERANFIAGLKQQADQQGSKLSMSDIGRKIGVTGEYADPTVHTAAVTRTAQTLQQQGVTITGIGAPDPITPAATAPSATTLNNQIAAYKQRYPNASARDIQAYISHYVGQP